MFEFSLTDSAVRHETIAQNTLKFTRELDRGEHDALFGTVRSELQDCISKHVAVAYDYIKDNYPNLLSKTSVKIELDRFETQQLSVTVVSPWSEFYHLSTACDATVAVWDILDSKGISRRSLMFSLSGE